MIAGSLSLQRLGVGLPVTRPAAIDSGAVLGCLRNEVGSSQNPPVQMEGFKLGWGGACLFVGGVLLRTKSLGHPAKAPNLELIKLGLRPSTKPCILRRADLPRFKCNEILKL